MDGTIPLAVLAAISPIGMYSYIHILCIYIRYLLRVKNPADDPKNIGWLFSIYLKH